MYYLYNVHHRRLIKMASNYFCLLVILTANAFRWSSAAATDPHDLPLIARSAKELSVQDELAQNVSGLLNRLLEGYDKKLRPNYGREPVEVSVGIQVRSMGPISEQDMAYSMDCYFRQQWIDERLTFDNSSGRNKLSLNIHMLEKLWKPDTYFHNGKHSYLHTITTPNKLLRISKDGKVYLSMRLTIKANCPMFLQKFPMDRQSCPLLFGSYSYTDDDIQFRWMGDKNQDIDFYPKMKMSQFEIIAYPIKNTTRTFRRADIGRYSTLAVSFQFQRRTGYFLIQIYLPCILIVVLSWVSFWINRESTADRIGLGVHSMLEVAFQLERQTGYYLIQYYVPLAIIVVLSWVSFWINREATADRVGLGVTTVLTLSTFGLDTKRDLPKVSYATALDWFVVMCFVYVIATLLEFAGVHYFTKVGYGEYYGETLDDEDSQWEDIDEEDADDDIPGGTAMMDTHIPPMNNVAGRYTYTSDEDSRYSQYTGLTPLHNHPTSSTTLTAAGAIPPPPAITLSAYNNSLRRSGGPGRSGGTATSTGGGIMSGGNLTLPGYNSASAVAAVLKAAGKGGGGVDSGRRYKREHCCIKFINCILSSEKYRKVMMKTAHESGINSVSKIDMASRVLFPLSFGILNLFYWLAFLNPSETDPGYFKPGEFPRGMIQ